MTLNITFPNTMSREKTTLILDVMRKCKASGYTLHISLGKLRQLYNSNTTKDKVDSIESFLINHNIEHTTKVIK